MSKVDAKLIKLQRAVIASAIVYRNYIKVIGADHFNSEYEKKLCKAVDALREYEERKNDE